MQITRTYQKLTNVEYIFDKQEIITALVSKYKVDVPPGSGVTLYLVYDDTTESDRAVLNVNISSPADKMGEDDPKTKYGSNKGGEDVTKSG